MNTSAALRTIDHDDDRDLPAATPKAASPRRRRLACRCRVVDGAIRFEWEVVPSIG